MCIRDRPIDIENKINGLKNFLLGSLNFQKGISNKKTNPILNEAIKMGGTELLRANLATGNALP